MINFLDLARVNQYYSDELSEAFHKVLHSGRYVLGQQLEAFEQEFAAYCHSSHCVGVASGLDALELILRAYDIGEGDEVIVPAHTFIATWIAVSRVGAKIVAVESSLSNYNIEAERISQAITSKTKAIIVVHMYGNPADIDEIKKIPKVIAQDIKIIEDAAQAHGALYKNKKIGSLGDTAAFSFYPAKNLGALGDAGAIVTRDTNLAIKLRGLRNYGGVEKYEHGYLGQNSRMDELQAAFLRIKLKNLDKENSSRRKYAEIYFTELQQVSSEILLPIVEDFSNPVWHLFVIRSIYRDQLQIYLKKNNIETMIHYPKAICDQPVYKGLGFENDNARILAKEVLSLPLNPCMVDEDILFICSIIKQFFNDELGSI